MLNQIVLVGRLVNDLKKEETQGTTRMVLTLAVPRAFKNEEGIYETDFIDCVLWNGIASTTAEYCKKGDIVGVKGRLQTDQEVNDDGEITAKTTIVIAEKVTFLSSKKEESND